MMRGSNATATSLPILYHAFLSVGAKRCDAAYFTANRSQGKKLPG